MVRNPYLFLGHLWVYEQTLKHDVARWRFSLAGKHDTLLNLIGRASLWIWKWGDSIAGFSRFPWGVSAGMYIYIYSMIGL